MIITDVELFTPATELMRKIKRNKYRFDLMMSLHLRLAMPLACLVLLIIGVPLAYAIHASARAGVRMAARIASLMPTPARAQRAPGQRQVADVIIRS